MATYNGDSGNNNYYGTDGDDFIYGNGGNDSLYGYDGNDTISGGTGNDYMTGGAGNDTYLISKNEDWDFIYDNSGANVIKFADVASTDITGASHGGNGTYLNDDLVLTYGGTNSQLTIYSYYNSPTYSNIQFQFSNSVTWSWADIKALSVVAATAGNDVLYGFYDSNDTLNGLAGTDTLFGLGGDDTLNGGTGNDYLGGGIGNDTYLIAKNDGQDTLADGGGTDVVKFTDVASTDVTQISRNGNDLLVQYGSSEITVQYYFYSADYRIEQFQFSNAVVWTWDDVKAKMLQGSNGNDTLVGYDDSDDVLNGYGGDDTLYGYGGNDTLNGGLGNDVLSGGAGNDTYLIAANGGQDKIYDGSGTDVVKFTDVASTDVTQISRNGYDLLVQYGSSQITVQYYFYSADYRIEQFQFSNAVVWAWDDIKLKVLQGNNGNNTLTGYDGSDDVLIGYGGDDALYGNGGNDTLNGGQGNDVLSGGTGNDTYLIAANGGQDKISDGSGTDVVKFADVASTDITLASHTGTLGLDLLLTYGGSSQLTVYNYFLLV